MKNIENEKQAENSSISLNYLSIPENCKTLLRADQDELDLIKKVFERCCFIKSEDLNKQITTFKLGSTVNDHKSSTIVIASNKFIKNLSEQLIVQYCALNETIASKSQVSNTQNSERDERDKKMLKDFDSLITFFLEHISGEICHSVSTLTASLGEVLTEKAASDSWDGISEHYEKYATTIDKLLQFDSSFCQIVTLYVQTFSVFKVKTSLLPSVSQSVISIVQEVSQFFALLKKHSEKINVADDKDQLKKYLSSFTRTLSWFIGMTAYKLVKVKETEKDKDKKEKESQNEKMQDLIIQSNLLSGGIENRFLSLFSQES